MELFCGYFVVLVVEPVVMIFELVENHDEDLQHCRLVVVLGSVVVAVVVVVVGVDCLLPVYYLPSILPVVSIIINNFIFNHSAFYYTSY